MFANIKIIKIREKDQYLKREEMNFFLFRMQY